MGKRALCKKIIEQGDCDDIDCEGIGGMFAGLECPFIDKCPVSSKGDAGKVMLAAEYLHDNPKKNKRKSIETNAKDEPAEYEPGMFYKSIYSDVVVMCDNCMTYDEKTFSGVVVAGDGSFKRGDALKSWIKTSFKAIDIEVINVPRQE